MADLYFVLNVTFSAAINIILEEYKYHPSILKIRKHSEQAKCFFLFGSDHNGRIKTNKTH